MSRVSSADWQPIETAPSDEEILVYTSQWGPIVALFNSEFGEWLSRMQCPVSITEEHEKPTHWMRLPEPPDGYAEGKAEETRQPKLAVVE